MIKDYRLAGLCILLCLLAMMLQGCADADHHSMALSADDCAKPARCYL